MMWIFNYKIADFKSEYPPGHLLWKEDSVDQLPNFRCSNNMPWEWKEHKNCFVTGLTPLWVQTQPCFVTNSMRAPLQVIHVVFSLLGIQKLCRQIHFPLYFLANKKASTNQEVLTRKVELNAQGYKWSNDEYFPCFLQ